MESFTIKDLKSSKPFLEGVRWDITPKIMFEPRFSGTEEVSVVDIHGYMFYVDLFDNKPTLAIMKNGKSVSQTVGYVVDVPEDLLREAMGCLEGDCVSGMYPITQKLEAWLKKEFGLPR